MLQRNEGSFLRRKLGSSNLPAMVRKIILTNYKPLCLFLSVYSIRYFTAAKSSRDVAAASKTS